MQAGGAGVRANVRYRLTPQPLGSGGFAIVYHAVSRDTGEAVALKRAKDFPEARARIKREIEAQRELAHPNIMPVLDYDIDAAWYTMPIAETTLSAYRSSLTEEDLVSLMQDLAEGLHEAHKRGLVHRDISPGNILGIRDGSKARLRWVVADWGMVRVPPENASRQLTRTGMRMGTPGYDAPEVDENPSAAGPSADVYSLGRIIAWFLCGQHPRPNVSLLPEGQYLHWRQFVRGCTLDQPDRRPQDMGLFIEQLQGTFSLRVEPPWQTAQRALDDALKGDPEAFQRLIEVAATNPGDIDIHVDLVAQVPTSMARTWAAEAPEKAAVVAGQMANHLLESEWGDRDESYKATPLAFVLASLRGLVDARRLDLAQDVANDYFRADVASSSTVQRARTLEWIEALEQSTAAAIAPAFAQVDGARDYYEEVGLRPRSAAFQALLGP